MRGARLGLSWLMRQEAYPRSRSIWQVKMFAAGGHVEFVMFEDVHGKEVYVNPKRVIWVREYGDQNTEISCGAEDKFTVRLSPAQAVAALGVQVR